MRSILLTIPMFCVDSAANLVLNHPRMPDVSFSDWWSAHVAPPGVSLLLFASVPVSSRCTLLKLHLPLSLLVVACTFSSLTSHCRLTCIGCLVHSLPLSVMVITPFPHPPSTDCHPGIIVNSKFCHGRL